MNALEFSESVFYQETTRWDREIDGEPSAVPSLHEKDTIPVLSNILIELVGDNTIRLTGTDLDVTIRCDMDADGIGVPGSTCVQARKVLEIASFMNSSFLNAACAATKACASQLEDLTGA